MMEDQTESRLIYTFTRGLGEEIQIALRKYNDKYYIDLRLWYQAKNENVFRPTKKGVFFSVDQSEDFKRGIERLFESLKRLPKEDAITP